MKRVSGFERPEIVLLGVGGLRYWSVSVFVNLIASCTVHCQDGTRPNGLSMKD